MFTSRPDDPSAIHLAAPEFPVRGDGSADDTAVIQAAIDKAGSSFGGGLVFIHSAGDTAAGARSGYPTTSGDA